MQNTTNFNLELYEANDNANLLDGYNASMEKIDAQLLVNQNNATAASAAAAAAQNAAESATTAAGNASSAAASAKATADQAASDVAGANSQIAQLSSSIDTINGQLPGKAPTMHSSATSEYGLGNAANYGHVKLTDTPGAQNATQGFAATPALVSAAVQAALETQVLYDQPATGVNGVHVILTKSGNTCVFSLQRQGSNWTWPAQTTKIATLPTSYLPQMPSGVSAGFPVRFAYDRTGDNNISLSCWINTTNGDVTLSGPEDMATHPVDYTPTYTWNVAQPGALS